MNTSDARADLPARHSLRWRLPVLISGLIALVLATFLWAAYRRVEATLVRTAGERAQGAADLIADLLDGQRTTDLMHQLSADPTLRRFLELRTDDARDAARVRLAALPGTAQRRIEIWDHAGTRLLELLVPGTMEAGTTAKPLPSGAAPSAAGIGALERTDDTVFSDVVADIRDEGSAVPPASPPSRLGYVRVRSTFVETPRGIFSRLVGRDAAVRIANRTGGISTDFARATAAPTVDLTRRGVAQYRAAGGDLRVGAVALIPATPWAAWVEFPFADVVAPARQFLNGMMLIALFFVAGAGVLATVLAGRITTPISEMNTAAAAVAAGDYSRRVAVARHDEIGHLGRTFNTMAAEVQTTSDALRKSEDSYRRLFASNPHPMWVYDVRTLRFLDVNDMAIADYGYSRAEFLAMTIEDIRADREPPIPLDSVADRAAATEMTGVWKHRKKDGTIIDVEVSSHESLLEGRAARALLAHDVTERLRSRQALQESETLFRGMAETMPHIVWTARGDGGFEYLNRHWFTYTGLTLEETRRDGWRLALHPDDRERTIEVRARAFQSGDSYEVAYRLRRNEDSAYRWHLGRAAPLRNDSGAIVIWVGTSTDVDDARRAAEELKALNADLEGRVLARTAELEAANQELESFSYSVSHDLRAPLRHVQGYVEMLTAATDGQLSDKSLRYLQTITGATVEMGDLIDDLLAFSRTARIQMSEGRVSLDDLVRDAIGGLEMAMRGRKITWNIPALPAAIGDPSMLKQVFANLLGNAVKYTRDREEAAIEVGCAGEEDGRQVLFVRDNGAGFDMRYAHKLFGVFQRLHRADEFEGTGIGLATVRRIISRHGGRTWAEGSVNAGATFYVTLKAAPVPPQHSWKEHDEFSETHSPRGRQRA
jgi:PAS domain S-box-containing protein